ncbi:MAG TPA: magnesium transporter CorA family protein [Flavilitoribacter sp.]|nr:magnesium transporter CorA family protein [Lewinella sp.]MCB9281189.1 magnesium transporter CorA family protein [Lewinellaceae bacterium]HMQ59642.1 magnesium transporter CorA family protein [Flavilitoribacter sp.]HMQ89528.1 magnesium transporter CorA family protein [Flavilitoribacter sp.]
MIHYYTKHGGRLRELEGPEIGCWMNITPPFSEEELEEVAQNLDIPLDFLTDSLDVDERSRYEREEETRFILLNSPFLNTSTEENDTIYVTIPIGIIITIDTVVTISSEENPVLQLFLDDKVKNFDPTDDSLFVLQIMEQNVFRFLTCLKKLNQRRNQIERELYDSSRNEELKQLLSIEKSLVYFMNSLSSNELLKMKMKRVDFLHIREDEDKSDLFEDIIIDNSQAMEMAKVYADILNGTMDAYGSIISNNLNLTIRRLTLITIILMVPTLIASFYGMNIQLPFMNNPYALVGIVLLSILLSALLGWYFQRKRMF